MKHAEKILVELNKNSNRIKESETKLNEASMKSNLVYFDNAGSGFSINPRSVNDYDRKADAERYFAGAEISWASPSYRVIFTDTKKVFTSSKDADLASVAKAVLVQATLKRLADDMDKALVAFAKKSGFDIKKV